MGPNESDQLGNYLTELMYDRRFVYEHTWTTGDFLIADNVEVGSLQVAFSGASPIADSLPWPVDAYENRLSSVLSRAVEDPHKLISVM